MLPIATALKEKGNKIISILGARNKELLILENEFAKISDELIVTTDDGSHGRKALVTEPLKEICKRNPKPDKGLCNRTGDNDEILLRRDKTIRCTYGSVTQYDYD